MPSKPEKAPAPKTLSGIYRHPIFSPKGQLEGLLLDVDGEPAQVVVDPHDHGAGLGTLDVGQRLRLKAAPARPSDKGEAVHPVYELHELVEVDGRRAAKAAAAFEGRVARLNYARHGEPNGVVLDGGDFVHLRPAGFRAAGLKIGDRVSAQGEARPLAGGGFVIEATRVNGIAIEPKKPKAKPPKH